MTKRWIACSNRMAPCAALGLAGIVAAAALAFASPARADDDGDGWRRNHHWHAPDWAYRDWAYRGWAYRGWGYPSPPVWYRPAPVYAPPPPVYSPPPVYYAPPPVVYSPGVAVGFGIR